MKVLSIRSAFYTPVILTAARFLPETGVPTELVFRTDHDVGRLLRDGELDFAQFAPSAALADRAKGITNPAVHIATINERDGFLLIGREPAPAFQWQDLIGKRVITANFAVQPEACLRFALHRQQVPLEKVTLVNGLDGMAAAAQAFADGEGDFVQLQDPMARNLVAQGKGHLVAQFGPAIGPIAFSSVATGRHKLTESPDQVRTFLQAYKAARQWIAEATPEAIAEAVAPYFESVDGQVLRDALAGYKALGTWTTKTAIARDEFETMVDMFTLYPDLTGVGQRYSYDECCDDSFAKAVDAG